MTVLKRIPVWLLAWLLASVPKAIVTLLGPVMVALMIECRNRPGWLFRPWFNIEDGSSVPRWYMPGRHEWLRVYVYNVWRNPAAGLRSWRAFSPLPVMSEIDYRGTIMGAHKPPDTGRWFWFLCWQGSRAGVYLTRWVRLPWLGWRWLDFRAGWKFSPSDKHQIDPNDARWGVGFTILSPTAHKGKPLLMGESSAKGIREDAGQVQD